MPPVAVPAGVVFVAAAVWLVVEPPQTVLVVMVLSVVEMSVAGVAELAVSVAVELAESEIQAVVIFNRFSVY